jgi:phage terminase large subunit-like protein
MSEMTFTYDQYVQDVLSGKQVACRWVKLACQRHLDDLEKGEERGIHFDHEAAQLTIAFFSLLKNSKGEWAGQYLVLQPWQQFTIAMIFGWKRADGNRRFRIAYEEVARKNGKSTIGAGLGLKLLLADGEPGAEIYTAATKKDQARIIHSEATRMAKSSPAIQKMVQIVRDNIYIVDTASKYEPLGADADSTDGLNVHGGLIDELHAHKTNELFEVLNTATGSRRQALIFEITTAGFNRQTICFEHNEYTKKVLSGIIQDDSWFGIIYTLDIEEDKDGNFRGDDWEDETVWVKSNPNLGISKKIEDMRKKAKLAKEIPSALNAFLRKELNVWTQSETKWVPREHWDLCGDAVNPDGLQGRTAYAAIDLSSNSDITAYILVFPPNKEGDKFQVLRRFYVPDEAIYERTHNDRVPYEAWLREGHITNTPGNVTDYDFIIEQIDQDMQVFDIKELAFDPWGSTMFQTKVQELCGEDFLVQFRQGYRSMSPAMKEMERLILNHMLAHGNDPVLNWMADNLVVRTDPAGNIKPDKEKSLEKIDGMVALAMAIDRCVRHEGPDTSVYEERGMVVI